MSATRSELPRNAAVTTGVEYVATGRPFSNFDWLRKRGWGDCGPLRRVLSAIRRLGGRTMVVECLPATLDDIAWYLSEIKREKPDFALATSRWYRLSFFDRTAATREQLTQLCDDAFLGYAVVQVNRFARKAVTKVHESVVRVPGPNGSFVHGSQCWSCVADGIPFRVRGYLYAQQDGIVTRCSHVAVRTAAASFHPACDMTCREMIESLKPFYLAMAKEQPDRFRELFEPFLRRHAGTGLSLTDIARREIAAIVHDGLEPDGMAFLLEKAGARTSIVALDATPATVTESVALPYQRYLYGSIESGWPAIVVFRCRGTRGTPTRHAVPVFGHTFDEDTWVTESRRLYGLGDAGDYLPSESWVGAYVCHDDNCGPNYHLPRHFLRSVGDGPRPDGTGVEAIILTLPKDVAGDAPTAEKRSLAILHKPVGVGIEADLRRARQRGNINEFRLRWSERFLEHLADGDLVLRTVLLKGGQYVEHLKRVRGWDHRRIDTDWIAEKLLSGFDVADLSDAWLWMVEVSVPELFPANRRKIGEVVFWASNGPSGGAEPMLARVPGAVFVLGQPMTRSTLDFYDHVEVFGCEDP